MFLHQLLSFRKGHLCKASPTVPLALTLELQPTAVSTRYWVVLDVDLNIVPGEGAVSDSTPGTSAKTDRKPTLRFDPSEVNSQPSDL